MKIKIVVTVMLCCGCGFDTDEPAADIDIYPPGPTKYEKIYVGPCTMGLVPHPVVSDEYRHYIDGPEDLHGFIVEYGGGRYSRGSKGSYNNLGVGVPCGACFSHLSGQMVVYDDKVNAMPYGWGNQRPPLNVPFVEAIYGGMRYIFKPELEFDPDYEDEMLRLDLDESCQLLIRAGVIKETSE